MMKFCPRCGTKNDDSATTCHACRQPLPGSDPAAAMKTSPAPRPAAPGASPRMAPPAKPATPTSKPKNALSRYLDAIGGFLGGGGAGDLNWTALFTGIFCRHSVDDMEDMFAVGTRKTTPKTEDVEKTWPRPWLYSRVLLLSVAVFGLFHVCVMQGFIQELPLLIVIGPCLVPFAAICMFFELNVWRNIGFPRIVSLFFIGGALSLISTGMLQSVMPVNTRQWGSWEASIAPLHEEPAKFIVVWLALKFMTKTPHRLLNGLLMGCAVGAGFSAFESIGYAFNNFIFSYDDALVDSLRLNNTEMDSHVTAVSHALKAAYDSIIGRGMWSFAGHEAWAAIHGAGLSIVARERKLDVSAFLDKRFLRLAAIPVVCHFLWNSPILAQFSNLKFAALAIAVWVVILFLINRGLAEVGRSAHSRVVA